MADEKTNKTDKDTPEAPAKAAAKSYVVAFSGISNKKGHLCLKGDPIALEDLHDPNFQLEIGAIVEVEEPKPAKKSKEEKPPAK